MTNARTVSDDTFARLQTYAIPLVDNIDSIIARLANHYDEYPPPAEGTRRHVIDAPLVEPEPTMYKTSRGVELPIPLNLCADYNGHHIKIKVTKNGFEWVGNVRPFTDPSSVAVAVKKSLGASDTTASTNGWTFWQIDRGDADSTVPQSLDSIRQAWMNEQARKNRITVASRTVQR